MPSTQLLKPGINVSEPLDGDEVRMRRDWPLGQFSRRVLILVSYKGSTMQVQQRIKLKFPVMRMKPKCVRVTTNKLCNPADSAAAGQEAVRERTSRGVLPVQRLNACVKELVSW